LFARNNTVVSVARRLALVLAHHLARGLSPAGYQYEAHSVHTEDGYILTLHRIPAAANGALAPAVFVQHGLLGASTDWVTHGRMSYPLDPRALAFDFVLSVRMSLRLAVRR
jgi:hypothetical protein